MGKVLLDLESYFYLFVVWPFKSVTFLCFCSPSLPFSQKARTYMKYFD